MKKTVLVLNDVPEMLELYGENLADAGYRVITQPYYLRDLSLFKEIKPDLVLVDYAPAEEERLWKLIHLLRLNRATQHLPVLACLDLRNRPAALQAYLSAQNILTLAKPFNADALLATVGSMVVAPAAQSIVPSQPAALEKFAHHIAENLISDIPYRVLVVGLVMPNMANEYAG
jgi:CheY-like chemotaxis protein